MTISNENKKSLKSFYALWAILTVFGVVVSLYAPGYLMPKSMSSSMHLSILTMVVFSVSAAPVAAGVYAATLYIMRNWAHKGDGVPAAAGPGLREGRGADGDWRRQPAGAPRAPQPSRPSSASCGHRRSPASPASGERGEGPS